MEEKLWRHASLRSKATQRAREGEWSPEEIIGRNDVGQSDIEGYQFGKYVSPSKRKVVVEKVMSTYEISQRRACRIIGQSRSSQRYQYTRVDDDEEITQQIVMLARDYGRYGYRRITAMLRLKGYEINHKRVYRIWRELGLKVPHKQAKRRRLWLNDGSCIRLRAERKNHVWSYDFVEARTSKGRRIKILNLIDEYTRECLCSHAAFRIRSEDVKDILREVMLKKGTPEYDLSPKK